MGVSIMLIPNDFQGWSDEKLDNYIEKKYDVDGFKIGSWTAFGETIETIRFNLENEEYGRNFPLFQSMVYADFKGWNYEQLDLLEKEFIELKSKLSALPINNQIRMIIDTTKDISDSSVSFEKYSGSHLEELKREFKLHYPEKPLENLYHLNHYPFDIFEEVIKTAKKEKKGILFIG